MVTFGGGSVKKNGVYDAVKSALVNHNYIEFWGIEPNPSIETLRKAIALGKENNVNFLLAVGGGSVIDGTKLISAGLCYEGRCVGTCKDGALYQDYTCCDSSDIAGNRFGNEQRCRNIAQRDKGEVCLLQQLPCIFDSGPDCDIHIEQKTDCLRHCGYFRPCDGTVYDNSGPIACQWTDGPRVFLQTLIEIAPKIEKRSDDYDLMADFMLSATMGLNGFLALGVTQDWCTHMIGHELTALHGLTHGATHLR